MNHDLSLKRAIVSELPWLFSDLGFRIVEDDFRPEAFGDSFVTLESGSLRVRFVRDRGQVWADVGTIEKPGKWWHLIYILEAIHGVLPESTFELKQAASLLAENLPAIAESLGPELRATEAELKLSEAERLRAFLRAQPTRNRHA
jgi:hypothetical protein